MSVFSRTAVAVILASVAFMVSSKNVYSQALAFPSSPTMWTEVYTDAWHYDSYIYDVGNKGKGIGHIYVDNSANPDVAKAWVRITAKDAYTDEVIDVDSHVSEVPAETTGFLEIELPVDINETLLGHGVQFVFEFGYGDQVGAQNQGGDSRVMSCGY